VSIQRWNHRGLIDDGGQIVRYDEHLAEMQRVKRFEAVYAMFSGYALELDFKPGLLINPPALKEGAKP